MPLRLLARYRSLREKPEKYQIHGEDGYTQLLLNPLDHRSLKMPHDLGLVTRQEAAQLLRISLRTLDNLVSRGVIPEPLRIGGRRLFHFEQLDRWVRTGCDQPSRVRPKADWKEAAEGNQPKRRQGRPRKPRH